ncbi:hypothetical protein SAY87_014667 [Trapa incisa]|uniref:BHLH domain-containing protein n=1 Tax=Trapa incisa TaxID=236973 RepID=A0AAN7GNY9_9MYRT|nr:hypothetical protein SAY87_014667 [Trapa incisa]
MYEDTSFFGAYGNHTMSAVEVADSAVGFTQNGRYGKGENEVEEDRALSKMGSCYNDENDIFLHEMIQDADISLFNQHFPSNYWDDGSSTAFDGIPPTPALLSHSTLQLQPQSSLSFLSPIMVPCHNSVLDLNVQNHRPPPPPPPLALMKELFQSLPLSGGSILPVDGGEYGVDHGGREGLDQIQNERVLEIAGKRSETTRQHPTTERERRTHMKEKFNDLRSMIPNSTRTDKASVVGDAVEYIKELKRTVDELKLLVEKKRCGREGMNTKRQKMDTKGQGDGDVKGCEGNISNTSCTTGIRSSMLRRKSKAAEIDVRVVDDEVTVKLVQQRRINCLLYFSRVLEELPLDLQYVSGGQIGDHYSFLFNSKIYEGCSVLADAVASKLMESMDEHYYSAAPPDHSQILGSCKQIGDS